MRVMLFSCDKCAYETQIKSNLVVHLNSVHYFFPENGFVCDFCSSAPYKIKEGLLKHIFSAHSEEVSVSKDKNIRVMLFSCDKCPYKSQHKHNLVSHLKFVHDYFPGKEFVCHLCSSAAKTKDCLLRHISNVHHEEVSVPSEMNRCNQCSRQFKRTMDLILHLSSVHNDFAIEKYSCDICSTKIKSRKQLNHHMTRLHSQNWKQLKFLCSDCCFETYQKSDIGRHQEKNHEGIRKEVVKCDGCPAEFKSKSGLFVHRCLLLSQHTLICDICKHKFIRKGNFRSHYANIHLKEKRQNNVYCDHCSVKIFKPSLASHIISKHTKTPRRLICNECGYSGTSRLRHWRRLHSNLPKLQLIFTCDSCEKIFHNRRYILKHCVNCGVN